MHGDILSAPGPGSGNNSSHQIGISRRITYHHCRHQIGISRRITIAALTLLLLPVVEFTAALHVISISQIQEGNICRRFYPDVDNTTTDPRCKNENENIQSELSTAQGWGFTFAIIPGVIMTVPYGMAADKYARRVILSLSLLGTFLVETVGMAICKYRNQLQSSRRRFCRRLRLN